MRKIVTVVATLVMVVGLFTVIGVLPMSTYTKQRTDTVELAGRLASLRADNARLQNEIRRLRSDSEVQRLAREQFGMVLPGQEVYAIPGLRVDAQVGTSAGPPTSAPAKRARFWNHILFWR